MLPIRSTTSRGIRTRFAVHRLAGPRGAAGLHQRPSQRTPAGEPDLAAVGELAGVRMPGCPGHDDGRVALLAQFLFGPQQQGEGTLVQRGVVVHPQVVVVVASDGLAEGAPHPPVPVQLPVTAQQPDAGVAPRDRLRSAVGARIVHHQDVEGEARTLLGGQRVQAGQRQRAPVVDGHHRGDSQAGALLPRRRVLCGRRGHRVTTRSGASRRPGRGSRRRRPRPAPSGPSAAWSSAGYGYRLRAGPRLSR